jgi:uncharacterized protein YjbI with pentapeptide repeats
MSDIEKPTLKPANDNPWYCLATLHGEQPAGDVRDNELLANKNRLAWNRWIATALSDAERASLLKSGFSEPQLAPFSPEEKSAFCNAFGARTGHANALPPEPTRSDVYGLIHDFTSTHFDRPARFDGFLFKHHASFSSTIFSSDVSFSEANFSSGVNFDHAVFSDRARFRRTTFCHDTDQLMPNIVWFGDATFSNDVHFDHATFSISTFFHRTKFTHNVSFDSVMFSENVEFRSATFSGDVFFSATFSGPISFVNAKFGSRTTFENAHFVTFVPDFRGATMHEATEWHDASWPPPRTAEMPRNRRSIPTNASSKRWSG